MEKIKLTLLMLFMAVEAIAAGGLEQLLERADGYIDVAPDSALLLCREAQAQLGDRRDSLYARSLIISGNARLAMGDMEEARSLLSAGRILARECGDMYAWINATADLGVASRLSQMPDSALALYNEALSAIPAGQYLAEKAQLLTSIAILYTNTGRFDEGVDYGEKAVEAAQVSGDIDMIMYANASAGAIHNLMGHSERAMQLLHSTIAQARRLKLPRYEIKAYASLIDAHLRADNRDSVEYYLRDGEKLLAQVSETSAEGLGFLEEKYVVYSALGRYRESLQVQQRLLSLYGKAATYMPIDKLWLRMARNYSGLGKADSARICYERAFELADSLHGAEVDNQLSDFYARYKTAERELEVSELERKNARSEALMMRWVAIALACMAVVAALLVWQRLQRRREQLRRIEARLDGVESERARLAKELHDGVCNDLYGIELMIQSSSTETDELLDNVERIRSDVRSISHELMPPQFAEVPFVDVIASKVGRFNMAGGNAEIVLKVTPETDSDTWTAIPTDISFQFYRIFQELLSNISRHSDATLIEVTLDASSNGTLSMEISHNGSPAETTSGGDGIGLNSIRQRAKSINAMIEGEPDGSKVRIFKRID